MADVTLRRVESQAEYQACVALQHETWGAAFTEAVPAAILQVSQKIGGVTAGAFAPDGRLLGFVFGMTGVKDGKLAHWSDILAVRPEARGLGLGRRLKLYQRDLLLPLGVRTMFWTYDPLVARNAHLNLVRLGARAAEYVPDMYGAATNSVLHGDLGTDRFVVAWALDAAPDAGAAHDAGDAPVVNAAGADGAPASAPLPDAPLVRVEIPAELGELLERAPRAARAWRDTTRRAFVHYLGAGYAVRGFEERGDRRFYVLARD